MTRYSVQPRDVKNFLIMLNNPLQSCLKFLQNNVIQMVAEATSDLIGN